MWWLILGNVNIFAVCIISQNWDGVLKVRTHWSWKVNIPCWPGHQQPWYWPLMLEYSGSSTRRLLSKVSYKVAIMSILKKIYRIITAPGRICCSCCRVLWKWSDGMTWRSWRTYGWSIYDQPPPWCATEPAWHSSTPWTMLPDCSPCWRIHHTRGRWVAGSSRNWPHIR